MWQDWETAFVAAIMVREVILGVCLLAIPFFPPTANGNINSLPICHVCMAVSAAWWPL
jgi:hypothetical protein